MPPEEYEAFPRCKAQLESFATVVLPEEKVEAIARSRMHERHAHLNALLDE